MENVWVSVRERSQGKRVKSKMRGIVIWQRTLKKAGVKHGLCV